MERRKYNKLVDSIEGFNNRKTFEKIREKEDLKFVMAFGFGFISLTFTGFGSGFLLGKYVFNWTEEQSLIFSLITGICTLILEAVLMLMRLNKWEQKRARDKKAYKVE